MEKPNYVDRCHHPCSCPVLSHVPQVQHLSPRPTSRTAISPYSHTHTHSLTYKRKHMLGSVISHTNSDKEIFKTWRTWGLILFSGFCSCMWTGTHRHMHTRSHTHTHTTHAGNCDCLQRREEFKESAKFFVFFSVCVR